MIFKSEFLNQKKWLIAIIALAFFLRIVGVGYGLPLWLVDDEPPFILAALKMLQLKTLLPVLHQEEFQKILYYPPGLAYLYLLPFSILVAVSYFFYGGPVALFSSYLASDLSLFFIIARVISVIIGTASVFLIYKIAKNIFTSEQAGIFSGFFTSVSLIHVALSMTGRHWLIVFFFSALVLFFLSHHSLSFKKRYLFATLAAGVGASFSIIMSILIFLIFAWYLFYERKPILNFFKEKFFYILYGLFAFLLVFPYLLYPASFGFSSDLTAKSEKTFWGVLSSPIFFAKTVAFSEPILILLAVAGLVFIYLKARRVFWVFFLFIYAYSAAFYFLFRFESRFLMGILPLYMILAGFGFYIMQKNSAKTILAKVLLILLLAPLVFTFRLSWLTVQNDSRILVRQWAEKNLPAQSKILVLARLTRLATIKEAVLEQKKIDPVSLRQTDLAEAEFDSNPRNYRAFHALNLYDLNSQSFYKEVETYVKENDYQYLLISPGYQQSEYFQKLTAKSILLSSYGSNKAELSLTESQFLTNPFGLFKLKELGPLIEIYKLNQ